MQVKDIIQAIEQFAPVAYQESYDNSGLQVGDITEAFLLEEIKKLNNDKKR